ncbi:MAG TPA: phage holin family protein [Acidimicrobiales bacterium]|nr:phage holin family protein [Acidimicrobiales bacterium]
MSNLVNPPDERPLGELFSDVTTKLQTLVRKEMELARAETKEQVTKATKGAAAFAVAGVVGLLGAIALVFAAAWGLAEVVPEGVAFLAVGLLLVAVAGLLAVQGRKKVSEVSPVPTQTIETVKEDVQTAKDSLQRGVQENSGPSEYSERWRRY